MTLRIVAVSLKTRKTSILSILVDIGYLPLSKLKTNQKRSTRSINLAYVRIFGGPNVPKVSKNWGLVGNCLRKSHS